MIDDTDQTWDEAESTRLFIARMRGDTFHDANEYLADTYTPHDEKGEA